jgi:hypothetical protein
MNLPLTSPGNQLITQQEKSPSTNLTLFEMAPQQMVSYAAGMANALSKIIEGQKLFTSIGGKKHVRVEGWCTLGSMLGFLPREVEVKELSDGSYEAKVELYSLKTGQIVGSASALCGSDETRWSKAERYARRSMAITRATGKAYRLGFAWIMSLAGYEGTPYEEMPVEDSSYQSSKSKLEPKKVSIFDSKNEGHIGAVKATCQAAGIDSKYWQEVIDMMENQPSTRLKEVIDIVKDGIKNV